MTVYELLGKPGEYQSLMNRESAEWEKRPHWFGGTPIGSEWIAPSLDIYKTSKSGLTLLPGDFSKFGTIPVFSQRAVEALGDLLRSHGELLPLHTPQCAYYAYNVLDVIDALDEEHSELVRMPGGGILDIPRLAFRSDLLKGRPIFKIPQTGRVFVTDRFVDQVQESGLCGFRFQPVWPLPDPERKRTGRRRPTKRDTA